MPRIMRIDVGGYCYHVINRANARLPVFFDESDYLMFERVLELAVRKFAMRILAYSLMPNHFHLVLYPEQDGDLSKFMHWLTLTHTQRWHQRKQTGGTGHLYQGRYKSFLIQDDYHLLAVISYVERNALRAKLVKKAEDWAWCSLARRAVQDENKRAMLSKWPISIPENYLTLVNTPQPQENDIRNSIRRCKPFGEERWSSQMIRRFGLEMTIRSTGRPKKGT